MYVCLWKRTHQYLFAMCLWAAADWNQVVTFKHGEASCWFYVCWCTMSQWLCWTLRHPVKYFQHLFRTVDADFIFIAPIFTLCWLGRLEEFAVQYLAQGTDCEDLISYHRSSNKPRIDPFEALPSPHLLSCERNTGKGMLQYTFVFFC